MDLTALATKIHAAERNLQQEAAEGLRTASEHEPTTLAFCRRLIAVVRVVIDEKHSAFPDTGWQVIVMALVVKVLATVRAAYTVGAAAHGREMRVLTRSALESFITAAFIAKKDSGVRAERWMQHAVIIRAELLNKKPDLSSEPEHLEVRDRILAAAPNLKTLFPNKFFWASGLGKRNLRALAADVEMEWYYSTVYWSGSQATHGSAISVEDYVEDVPGAPRTTLIYQFGLSVTDLHGQLAVCCDLLIRALILLNKVLKLDLDNLASELTAEYKAVFGADTAERVGRGSS